MPVVYVIADTPDHHRAVQENHPPAQMSAYRLEYDGDQETAVAEFASQFPVGTQLGTIAPKAVHSHRLAPRLEEHDLKPGEATVSQHE